MSKPTVPITPAFAKRVSLDCAYRATFDGRMIKTDAETYVYHRTGPVTAFDPETCTEHEIGTWGAFYVALVEAVQAGLSVYEVMDQHHETLCCYEALHNPRTGCFIPQVQAKAGMDEPFVGNVLIIDQIDLPPALLGVKRRVHLIEMIGQFRHGAALVAVEGPRVGVDAALRAGFNRMEDSEIMIRCLESVIATPQRG